MFYNLLGWCRCKFTWGWVSEHTQKEFLEIPHYTTHMVRAKLYLRKYQNCRGETLYDVFGGPGVTKWGK